MWHEAPLRDGLCRWTPPFGRALDVIHLKKICYRGSRERGGARRARLERTLHRPPVQIAPPDASESSGSIKARTGGRRCSVVPLVDRVNAYRGALRERHGHAARESQRRLRYEGRREGATCALHLGPGALFDMRRGPARAPRAHTVPGRRLECRVRTMRRWYRFARPRVPCRNPLQTDRPSWRRRLRACRRMAPAPPPLRLHIRESLPPPCAMHASTPFALSAPIPGLRGRACRATFVRARGDLGTNARSRRGSSWTGAHRACYRRTCAAQ